MKYKILLLILSTFLINLVSANSLQCSLSEKYFQEGTQILYASNESIPDGISINIICSNLDKNQRLLSISITNSSPMQLTNALPKDTIDFLRINERDKILFSSSVIPVSLLNNSETFFLSVSALSEKNMSFETADCSKTINIPKKVSIIDEVGNKISPSSPFWGLIFVVSIILLILYFKFKKKN